MALGDRSASPLRAASLRWNAHLWWLLAIVIAAPAVIAWGFSLEPGSRLFMGIGDSAILLAALAALVSSMYAAHRPGTENRRAWTLMVVSMAIWSGGMAVWTYYGATRDHQYPFPSLADVGFVGYSLPAAAALLSFKRPAVSPVAMARSLLDAAVIAVAVLFISWTTVLGVVYHGQGMDTLADLTGLAYPVVDVAMVSLVLVLTMRSAPEERLPWLCLSGGLLVLAVTDSIYVKLTFEGIPGTTGSPLAAGWVLAFLLVAFAGAVPEKAPRARGGRTYRLALEMLPYLPVIGAVVLAATGSIAGDPVLLITGAVLLALVVGRQLLIVLENVTLTRGLEAKVEERTAELLAAQEDALESTRLKSEFLATMSHEIRTPMNGVVGLTALLLETPLTEHQRRYAEGVGRAGHSLLALIDDILDFSKLEAGKVTLEREPFDPRDLVGDVAALVAEGAQAKRLELVAYCHPEVPTRLVGDAGRVRQVLLNLASNAVKFTARGEVAIRVTVPEREGNRARVLFEVRDTGIGIAKAEQARVFDSFAQADASTTRRYGGTGLGLAISRRLAEAMGGEIGVRSAPGQGSCFWFSLPMAAAGEWPAEPSGVDLSGLTALVVDDNATNRLLLETHLEAWGLDVECVPDAHEALDRARAAAAAGRPFDLALLDMCMPGMSGLELATEIAGEVRLGGTRIVILSSDSELDGAELERTGVHAWLLKPVRSSQLYDTLMRVVGHRIPAAPGEPRAPRSEPRTQRSGRVLVVEDNTVNQLVARDMAARLGYEVDVVSDGAQALTATAATQYAAVLMDCHMPVMDGFAATRAIRERGGRHASLPIIAMTAGAMAEDRERSREAGMDGFLAKPVSLDDLERVLSVWTDAAAREACAGGGPPPAARGTPAAAPPP
ncbi:response regulator, partial [Sinomonas halotolerans]